MIPRALFALGAAVLLIGAGAPETRVAVTLAPALASEASGRLLIFAELATPDDVRATAVDLGEGSEVSVAARDVTGFGTTRQVTIDTQQNAFPKGFAALPAGDYRLQAVLDRNGDYNYGGRGPGDLVSGVITVRLPLATMPSIALDHEIPAEAGPFDTTGLPPVAAAQIAASRPHLHDERIASALLTRFRGTPQTIAAWVLTPPGYDPAARRTYPTIYTAGGFGATHRLDGQMLSRQWHLMETGVIPPMIWVALDFSTPTGTTEFADSVNNGPWGQALVAEMIPALEARYRMDARPSGRFLTGHSSGGWFALWALVTHPDLFGGAWASSPDPSDFHDFLGANLYAPGANLYHDPSGAPRPLERADGRVRETIEQAARLETVLGHAGGQLQSFDWTFSPRRADGSPAPLFDRESGAVDPVVASYWRDHYDIGRLIQTASPRQKRAIAGKLHLRVGTADSYYLDGPAHRLEAAFRKAGVQADFTYIAGATHSMNQLYASGGDRNAFYREMTQAMLAIARPVIQPKSSTPAKDQP